MNFAVFKQNLDADTCNKLPKKATNQYADNKTWVSFRHSKIFSKKACEEFKSKTLLKNAPRVRALREPLKETLCLYQENYSTPSLATIRTAYIFIFGS